MPLEPKYLKIISDIASILYAFLPANPHPYANQSISFKGAANELGLSKFWTSGSKQVSISVLLSNTYEYEKGKFCKLIISIVNKSIIYRMKKKPLTKSEVVALNNKIFELGFKIPELWDNNFLMGLDNENIASESEDANTIQVDYERFLSEFLLLTKMEEPHKRGFAFEKFLNELFGAFKLNPRKSFRIVGEQIDGSIELDGECYLIEAKWHKEPLNNSDLLTFNGKISGKSSWTRGILISYSGFSKEGIIAFSRGRSTNLIVLDGQDMYALLYKKAHFIDVLRKKIRWAAETGEINKSVFELFD